MEQNMEDKPRYSRVTDIIDLIILMQSRFNGITLADIQEKFSVSRRTAERMRDSLMNILPSVQELETDGRIKRWGFVNYSMCEVVNFTNNEIAILEKIKNKAAVVTQAELAKIIDKI